MKAIAIITVAMAHCTYVDCDIQRITDIFGTIGVPIFLITGGLFFRNDRNWKSFLSVKTKRIIVPWILWGNITYILHIISDRKPFSAGSMLLWILGHHTWLYYVPVIMICCIIFWFCASKKYAMLIGVVSIVSYLLTILGKIDGFYITNCQNVFNWIGFFSLGVFLQNYGFKERIWKQQNILFASIMSICIFITIGILYFRISKSNAFNPSYWNYFSIPFELISCICVYYISYFLAKSKVAELLIEIGKNSYVLFFSHMQLGINIVNVIFVSFWNYLQGSYWGWITVMRGGLLS